MSASVVHVTTSVGPQGSTAFANTRWLATSRGSVAVVPTLEE